MQDCAQAMITGADESEEDGQQQQEEEEEVAVVKEAMVAERRGKWLRGLKQRAKACKTRRQMGDDAYEVSPGAFQRRT